MASTPSDLTPYIGLETIDTLAVIFPDILLQVSRVFLISPFKKHFPFALIIINRYPIATGCLNQINISDDQLSCTGKNDEVLRIKVPFTAFSGYCPTPAIKA